MSRTPLVILASEIAFMLEEAIDNKDWTLVCNVYSELTGEVKEVEDDKVDNNSSVDEFLSALREKLKKELEQEKKIEPKKKVAKKQIKKTVEVKKSDDFTIDRKRKSRKPVTSAGNNKFETMTEIIAEAGRDNGFDKINDSVKPSERTRRPFTNKRISCLECSKSVEVHPMFVKENYVCDNCIQKRGRS
jgi:hypothetical protein